MRKLLNNFWPILVIIFIIAIFFYPVWLQGKIPLPGDFIVGTYYPWLDYKWPGYVFGVPVKNPITTDVVSFIFPMQMYAVDLLKQGTMPLWNPLILTGTPLLANFQSAPFSPTNIFHFILPKLSAWSLQIIFQPLLAAIFLYLLLREFGLSKLSSISGGIFFAFAGFSMIWMEWNGHSLTAAFFPLIFLLTIKWLKTGKLFFGGLLSAVFALQIFSGYPQIILYEVLALLILLFFYLDFKKAISLGIFLGLGIGIAAIQILPALELLKYSQRGIEDVLNTSAFLPWQYLITFFAPDFFGNHATGNFWGEGDYTLVAGYSGVVVTILSGLGLLSKFEDEQSSRASRTKNVRFAFGLIILSLFIALPNPLSIFFKQSGLLALQAASAHRSLVLSNLGLSILAAFGLEVFIKEKLGTGQIVRALYLPGIFILGFGIAALISLKLSLTDPQWSLNFKVALRNLILPAGLLLLTAAILFCSLFFKKYAKVFSVLLILLGIFELFRFGWKFTPFSEKNLVFPKTPILEFLELKEKPFRVVAEDVIPINFMMNYGIETVEGYDAVYPLSFAKYLGELNSGKEDATPMGRYGSVTNFSSPMLDAANAKYFLTLKRDKNRKPDPNGSLPEKFQGKNFAKVYEDKSVAILENMRVYPRAYMEENGIKRAVNYKESPNLKEIELETKTPITLFINDIYYPGWQVKIDGMDGKLTQGNRVFMIVPIKTPGKHEVKLEYKPVSFEIGKLISFISVASLALLWLYYWRWMLIKH